MRNSIGLLILLAAVSPARADTLIYRNSAGGTVRRQAEIVDLRGDEVVIQGPTRLNEAIPRQRLIRFETTWDEAYTQAEAASQKGDHEQAAILFRQARQREQRPWARREASAGLVRVSLNRGDWLTAGEEFLAIVSADAETLHWAVAPLPWRSIGENPAAFARAGQWMKNERLPVYRLLGASWLLAGPERATAMQVLEKLSLDLDRRIALLAQVQLFRTKLPTSQATDPPRWQGVVEQLPAECQAVGWFLVGEAFARHGDGESAALAYLRVPILRPEVSPLAAESLLAAGAQLEKMMRRGEALSLYREILAQHPATQAAQLAKTRLAAPAP